MPAPKLLLAALLLCCTFSINAQHDFSARTWMYIDTSITFKRNLRDVEDVVKQLEQKAWQEKKYFYAARCLQYQVMIKDQTTEDSLYLQNSARLDEQLATQLPPAYQYALHLLQASRLHKFKSFSAYRRQFYKGKGLPVNYAEMSDRQLDSMATIHFEKAKSIAATVQVSDINETTWLSSDPLQFLFKPGLFDIAITEQIKANQQTYIYSIDNRSELQALVALSADECLSAALKTAQKEKSAAAELALYIEWARYHQADPAVYYFIETRVHEYVYNLSRAEEEENGPYEKYLTGLLHSPYNMVKASAVYQLCQLWASYSARYFPGYRYYKKFDDLLTPDHAAYDTAYRYHAAKALQLFNENRNLLDSFQYMKENLAVMEASILKTELKITLQETNLINEPFLAEVKFKNAGTLYYRVVEAGTGKSVSLDDDEELQYHLRKKALVEKTIPLPATGDDHNYHNFYLPMDAMGPGNYVLLFSPRLLSDTSMLPEKLDFRVSNIVLMNSKQRVYVLSRKTGKPLYKAAITAVYDKKTGKAPHITYQRLTQSYKLTPGGYVDIKDKRYNQVEVSLGDDHLTEVFANMDEEEETGDEVYSKEQYESLVNFYDEKLRATLYTDRGIYRPGQLIYYKAIFITNDKSTGEAILVNETNLKDPVQGSLFRKWLKEKKPYLYIKDPFDKIIDSVKAVPNEYGSVSGSFRIPKTAATGEWHIDFNSNDEQESAGTFKVEEYKRPTYEVNIENPVKALMPKDSFSFRVVVKSFAGSPMNGVKVNYTITRSGYLPALKIRDGSDRLMYMNDTVIVSSGFTGNDGELSVTVFDTALMKYTLADSNVWRMDYLMEAEAADATGESYTASNTVYISSRPVQITMELPKVLPRSDIDSILFRTFDENAGLVNKTIVVKAYRQKQETKFYHKREYTRADLWLYSQDELVRQFPNEDLLGYSQKEPAAPAEELVWEKTILTSDSSHLDLRAADFPAGEYVLRASCREKEVLTGESETLFSVFDDKSKELPAPSRLFTHLSTDDVKAGDTAEYYYGNSFAETFSVFQCRYFSKGKQVKEQYFFDQRSAAPGLHQYKLKIPASAVDKILFTHWFILDNELHSSEENIDIKPAALPEPEIMVEKYRKKIAPGSKETFTVSIKTKNIKTVAELMTTMYDASLDKLSQHDWSAPYLGGPYRYLYSEWLSEINNTVYNYPRSRNEPLVLAEKAKKARPLWWLNPMVYSYSPSADHYTFMLGSGPDGDGVDDVMGDWSNKRGIISGGSWKDVGFSFTSPKIISGVGAFAATAGAIPFLRIGKNDGSGYGRFSLTSVMANQVREGGLAGFNYSSTFIPEAQQLFGVKSALNFNTLANFDLTTNNRNNLNVHYFWISQAVSKADSLPGLKDAMFVHALLTSDTLIPASIKFVLLNETVVPRSKLKELNQQSIFSAELLPPADAEALFGKQAAAGAIIVLTNDYLALLQGADEPVKTRKNFNETAFFFPAVYAGKDGYYNITFTMPESVTEWNWKMLAHTKNAVFAYAEKSLRSQLPLMVQPNMPRLLYQGDRIVLKSRITNLDTAETSGKIVCKIEDAVTGEEITSGLLGISQQPFAVYKKSDTVSSFELKVPPGQLNPLKISITVRTAGFADGEEHIIPVLSPKVFVKDTRPFSISKAADTTVALPPLPAGAEMYGAGISIMPQPQAAMIWSLPWLANYPYWCAEQTFNKMLAYAVACKLLREDTVVQRSYELARNTVDKETTSQEKLPGGLADETMPWLGLDSHTTNMQQQLFNLLDTSKTKPAIDELLKKLQKMQTAEGGIAWFNGSKPDFYITCYLLRSFGWLQKKELLVTDDLDNYNGNSFIEAMVKYTDNRFASPFRIGEHADTLSYFYSRGYWLQQYPLSADDHSAARNYLLAQFTKADHFSLYRQAQLIIAAIQYHQGNDSLFNKSAALLRSIRQQAIEDETYGLRWKELADTDDLTSSAEETIALLAEAFASLPESDVPQKLARWMLAAKSDHNWKSTKATAAAIQLLLEQKLSSMNKQQVQMKSGTSNAVAGNDLLSGRSFDFIKTTASLQAVNLQKQKPGPAGGNLFRYYFTSALQPELLNKEVQLKKEFFRWSNNDNTWVLLQGSETLKLADKIKVVISISTARMLQYVLIDDKRAALFEPLNTSSGYEYNTGLSYYQSVRDAGSQFFAEYIPAGKTEMSYEMKVAQEGNFISGPAVLQCMYKPELTAYSGSTAFRSVK